MNIGKVKRISVFFFVVATACLLCSRSGSATEIRYMFVNPSFGGSPLNGSFLLGSATAQNSYEEDDEAEDSLKDFEEQLTRRVLSDISRKITNDAFGEDELLSGHYTIGDFSIDVDTGSGDGIVVEINDSSTGGSTIIEVPRY